LVAATQVDKRALVIEPLQIKRDAHAKRGGRPKEPVQLHGQRQVSTLLRG
jgi:hypothetical protein